MTATTLGINSLPRAQISRATAMKNVIRQIAGSFGIALLSTVIQNRQYCHFLQVADNINGAREAFQAGFTEPLASAAWRQAAVFAYDDAFFLLAVICFCALFPAVFFKKPAPKFDGKPATIEEEPGKKNGLNIIVTIKRKKRD